MKGEEQLEGIVARLVEGLKPERIYLFGSRATGLAGSDSDVDLLVVIPESNLPRYKREVRVYDLLWGLRTPVDVIVLTEDEFRRSLLVKTSLAASVVAHGRLLYG